jgi:hypothetical protein
MNKKYTYAVLSNAVLEANSYAEVMRLIKAPHDSYRHIQKMIISYCIDTSHFKATSRLKRGLDGKVSKKNPSDILVVLPASSTYRTSRNTLMYAMLSSGLEYKCMMNDCEKPEPIWRGEPCSLDIDHIDGDWRNCTIGNLRFLCGRCHYQVETNTKSRAINPTDLEDFLTKFKDIHKTKRDKECLDCNAMILRTSTRCPKCQAKSYVGGNRIDYPTVEQIIEGVHEYGYSKYSKMIGVSDNGLRKHLIRKGVNPLPSKLKE